MKLSMFAAWALNWEPLGRLVVVMGFGFVPLWLQAQVQNPSYVGKVYVSDVGGEASVYIGESPQPVALRAVYPAPGTVFEIKRPVDDSDRRKFFSTLVYSNGTGVFLDADTRFEIKRFVQEPFTPHRSDMEIEPSTSQSLAFIARGTVGVHAGKLAPGSSMVYETPHGAVTLRGRRILIEVDRDVTRISLLEGEGTIRAGPDGGERPLRAGEQAIIRAGLPGQPSSIEITPIAPREIARLDDRVTMAYMAKRTVYFEVRKHATVGTGSNLITAFDDATGAAGDITAVPIVPDRLPLQFTISPASL